jgi:acetoacetate decarboxylase
MSMSWYWATGQSLFAIGLILTGCALFLAALVATATHGDYHRSDDERLVIRRAARAAFLLPIIGALCLVVWPLLAVPALVVVTRLVFRAAWIEPPAEKAERLRRKQEERDREIARLEREAGIR